LGAAVALAMASVSGARAYPWGGIALLLIAWAPWRRYPANILGALVAAYCAWLFGNALFITPYYAAEAVYLPLMLFTGFAAVAASREQEKLFRVAVLAVSLLVLLGLMQYLFGIGYLHRGPFRAAGIFMTANTQGTVIIMLLAPLAALYLSNGSRQCLAISLWLFAGLVATESRGAMLALLAGLGFAALALMGAPVIRFQRRGVLIRAGALIVGFCLVWIAVMGTANLVASWARGTEVPAPSVSTWVERRAWDRGELYSATLSAIAEHPVAGAGANMFFPAFEARKPDLLRGSDYRYAHSDYLQIWLEYGAPGLLLLLALVAGGLHIALRDARKATGPQALVCGSALAACFAHAAVDFPLYIPLVLLLCGAFLGTLASQQQGAVLLQRVQAMAGRIRLSPLIRGTAVFAMLCWLAQPVIAELAIDRSISLLQRGEARDALYWFSVARRLQPRHAAPYWSEALIWRDQAIESKQAAFAAEADALYAQGMRVNPYEVVNLLGRVRLHREHPELLNPAAKPEEILAWSKRAVDLRPQQPAVQAEYARSLANAGRLAEARQLAQRLNRDFPDSDSVKRLSREL
jgi:O-antigen ligase